MSQAIASATMGATVLAGAAPALCAVHCAAMPVVFALLPTLQLGSRFSGVCMHGVARKLALYFVAPLGLTANAFNYPQHESEAVVAVSLTGITSVVLAAIWAPVKRYQTFFNVGGCTLMLGASYMGHKIADGKGTCSHSCCSE